MPINIPHNLPAKAILEGERIFVMDEERAVSQDIRPLNIVLLNLMPEKEKAETQLLRLLGNSPLQINITLLHTETYESKTTSKNHLDQFYKTFGEIKHRKYDGMIITGAPVEHLQFEDVDYWPELVEIMEWAKTNVTSTMHICWGAQAGLYYHYGIQRQPLPRKCSGVYRHRIMEKHIKLLRGFDDQFFSPHSHYMDIQKEEVEKNPNLLVVSYSDEAGVYIVKSKDGKFIFVTGHPEYDADTLQQEYIRDLERGIDIHMPENYFPNDNPGEQPVKTWRSHANLLFINWLNYYVYQETPFVWE